MSEIQLDDGTINMDGEWLTAEDLARKIQEKMYSGDMKITNLAAALEELNTALENSQAIEVRLVLTSDDYEKLKAFGGEDDKESVRNAIQAFVGSVPGAKKKKKLVVKCPQCNAPIDVATKERPVIIECQQCGTSGRLTEKNRWAKLDQD